MSRPTFRLSPAVLILGAVVAALALGGLFLARRSPKPGSVTQPVATPSQPSAPKPAAAVPTIAATPQAAPAPTASAAASPAPTSAVVASAAQPSPSVAPTPAATPAAASLEGNAAEVQVNGQPQRLAPNALGDFPRVFVSPGVAIPVAVHFAEGDPGERVAIEIEDGGQVDGAKLGKASALDEASRLRFNFKVNDEAGAYRVVLRRGADVRMLDFWVGAPRQPQVSQ